MKCFIDQSAGTGFLNQLVQSGNLSPTLRMLPVAHVFLHQIDGRHKIVYAIRVSAIYAVHNEFRRNTNRNDFKKCVYREERNFNVRLEVKRAVWEILSPF